MDDLFRIAVSNAAWAAGLALVAAAGSRLFRRRPALAHTLWLLVLLKLVTPSVLNVAPPWGKVPVMDARAGDLAIHVVVPAVEITSSRSSDAGSPEKRVLAPSPLHAASTPTAGTWPWRILIALGWLAGAVIWWACVVLSIRRFRKLLRVCIAAPEALQERVKQIAARIGLGARRLPRVMIIPARIPPFVWASLTGRPRLLLPHELWGRLDESQQNALLAHELAHLKRGDHWVRWLEAIVLGLYWWDPIAWLARRELERTEEESCDAWVVWSQPSAAGSYAEALVATAAFLSEVHRPLPIGGSGFRSTSAIKRRLEMLLSDAAKPSIGRARSMKLLVLAALCLPLLPVPAGENRSVRAGEPTEQSQGTKAQAAGQRAVVPGTVVGAPIVGGQFVVIRPVVRHVGGQLELEPSPLQPAHRVELNSPMSGTLQKALCKPGQQVKKGDVLFQFDARSAELELQKAEAEVMRMQARLTGFDLQPGSRRSGEGQARFGEAQATLQSATADRDLMKLKLESTRVKAPFDGVIARVVGSEESFIQAGAALTTLRSDAMLALDVYIEERTARRFDALLQDGKNGAADVVRIAVRDERDFPRKGLIDFIDREVQPLGQVRLRVLVSNVDRSLRPGLLARVQIQAGAPEDSIVVPDSSLIENNGRRYVCVLAEDNTIVRRFVEAAERVDDLRMIERGLSVNDWVLESRINPALIGSKLSEQAILRVDAAAKPPIP